MKIWRTLIAVANILPALLLPLAATSFVGSPTTYAAPAVDAKIEIVWPHDENGQEVVEGASAFVNVEVYLTHTQCLGG